MEVKVTVGGEESFTWNEKTETCSKISAFESRYYAPSDTDKKDILFTLTGDAFPTKVTRDDCCNASKMGANVNVALL